ncbi:MAG: DPP IV N-terminal domain-containing protein [Myxococcota bacterium]
MNDRTVFIMFRARTLACLGLLSIVVGCEPGAQRRAAAPSIADPVFLEQYAATYRFRLGKPSSINVTRDGDAVLFLRSEARSFVRNLYSFDVATRKETVLLTAEQILAGTEEELSVEEKARRERMRLAARGIATYDLSNDGKRMLVPLSGRLFVVERADALVKELRSDAGYPIDPQFSPDASKVTCVRNGDVYVIDIAQGKEIRLTTKTSDTITNGEAEFIAQEEMSRYHGTWWSPDGTRLVYQQTDTAGLEIFHILDPMHPEKAPQTWPYPRAGKKNATVRLGIIPAVGGKTTWIEWDHARYPYLATVKWTDHGPLTLVVQNREQTEAAVLVVDDRSGKSTLLFKEHDAAWLNIDQDVPRWLPEGRGFLWTTERRGTGQLELRKSNGELLYAVTPQENGYGGLLDVDVDSGEVFVSASRDPTERHIVRTRLFDPRSVPVAVTREPGVHRATFSKGHGVFVQTSSTPDGKTRWLVRRRDGSEIGELRSVAETPPFTPNVELVTVGDDRRYHALVIRPRNVEAGRKYPVIVYVYAGPQWAVVSRDPSNYLVQQWIADHGYIVVALDGRGTPGRGRAWERAIQGSFIDLPLADQVAGLQALGSRFAELDLGRVGIYGWSFGGYFSAMAVMRRGDVYHAGVAGAPVADWLDYDTHYTERYLGLPDANADGYKESSVLTYAEKLERPLLIIHGTADDNVYFTHALKISDALFRAGKQHDFLPLSNFTHMVPDPLVTTRLYTRIVEHFDQHLR